MIGRKSIAALGAILLLGYAAAPYVTLYRLMDAMRRGDTRTLEAAVDWNAVRAGLKQDIAEGLVGDLASDTPDARTQLAFSTGPLVASDAARPSIGSSLPPFGASFVSGIAGSMVDREVNAQHLAAMMRQLSPAEPEAGPAIAPARLRHAFFDSPLSFELSVLCPGQDLDDQPLRVRLELHGAGWTVVRAWVPQDLIDLANART